MTTTKTPMKALFDLGQCAVSASVAESVEDLDQVKMLINRHASGDWGDLCDSDKELNNEAIELGNRILSAYHVDVGEDKQKKVYVITEADRTVTTVFFPEDY